MLNEIKLPFKVDTHRPRNGNLLFKYRPFINHIQNKGFTYIGCGSFRETYARNNIVIKIPKNGDGLIDNVTEHYVWHKYKNKPTNRNIFCAPCRLLPNFSLMMVKIDIFNSYTTAPFWTKNLLDGQYGSYKGRAVSHDFALEVKERFDVEDQLGFKSAAWHSDWLYHFKLKLKNPVFW